MTKATHTKEKIQCEQQQHYHKKIEQIPNNIHNYSYYMILILMTLSFSFHAVQDIKQTISSEKRVIHMDHPENVNALMMKLINDNNN